MKNSKGFTLVELIAVIVVILILAAIALPRIGDMRGAAQRAQIASDSAVALSAVERAITEGTVTNGTPATALNDMLLINSPLTGVPYVSSTANVTFGGNFPSYTATATAADVSSK